MARLWYGHFDSTPEDERELLAEDWAKYIRAFITDGVRNGGTTLQVESGGGMSVKINPGIANVQGYILYVDEDGNGPCYDVPMPVSNPSLPRIDRIVLRLSMPERRIYLAVKTGAPAATPEPPELTRTSDVYEFALADVTVPRAAVSLVTSNVVDQRLNQNLCGLVNSLVSAVYE